jgi:hypothetical protein
MLILLSRPAAKHCKNKVWLAETGGIITLGISKVKEFSVLVRENPLSKS